MGPGLRPVQPQRRGPAGRVLGGRVHLPQHSGPIPVVRQRRGVSGQRRAANDLRRVGDCYTYYDNTDQWFLETFSIGERDNGNAVPPAYNTAESA